MGKNKWISVEDNLPQDGLKVMVWKTNPDNPHWNTYGYGHLENSKWYLVGGTNHFPVVTHWATLIKPPKSRQQ